MAFRAMLLVWEVDVPSCVCESCGNGVTLQDCEFAHTILHPILGQLATQHSHTLQSCSKQSLRLLCPEKGEVDGAYVVHLDGKE